MAYRQNSTVDSSKLIIGNCKVETSATAGGTYVNLGIGRVTNFSHNVEPYTVMSGNGPDPIEGIARETCEAQFELLEYDASVLSAIQCGAVSAVVATTLTTINGGGNATLTPRAFKFTNTRMVSGSTKQTVITVYYATLSTGLVINFKDDQDTDPLGVMPFTMVGECDTSRTAGSQLYKIERDL